MGDGVIFVTFVAPFVSGENDEKCIGVLVTVLPLNKELLRPKFVGRGAGFLVF
jgi:hypothetical protein